MRKNYPILFLALLVAIAIGVGGCSKKIEQIKRNMVEEAVTNGRWLVQTFTDGDSDITSQFASYEFQFYTNGTVTGFKGTVASNGTWIGDPNALTISSNFPSANDTLMRLNDTWKITNNTYTMVEAKPSNGTRMAFLKLIKKP